MSEIEDLLRKRQRTRDWMTFSLGWVAGGLALLLIIWIAAALTAVPASGAEWAEPILRVEPGERLADRAQPGNSWTRVYVGVGWTDPWVSELYLAGDASETPSPTAVTWSYYTRTHEPPITVVSEIAGYQEFLWRIPNVLEELFPQREDTSGTLVVEAPFRIRGWIRTYARNGPGGYGQQIEASVPRNAGYVLEVFGADGNTTGLSRFNLWAHNDSTYQVSVILIDQRWHVVGPRSTIQLRHLLPYYQIEVLGPAPIDLVASQIDESTDDPATQPILILRSPYD